MQKVLIIFPILFMGLGSILALTLKYINKQYEVLVAGIGIPTIVLLMILYVLLVMLPQMRKENIKNTEDLCNKAPIYKLFLILACIYGVFKMIQVIFFRK